MGATAHKFRSGEAGAFVLLHGFTGSFSSFATAATLAPADGRAIWAINLPGHAADAPIAASFSENVAAIAETIGAIAGAGCHIVGYSLGARVGAALLCDHGELVGHATLIGAHLGLEGDDEREGRRRADRAWIDLLRRDGIVPFVAAWEAQTIFASQRKLSREELSAQRRRRLKHDPEGLARSLETMGLAEMPSYWQAIAGASARVTLVTGERDEKFGELARRSGLRHRIVAGAGHNVVLEAPGGVWSRGRASR